MEASIEAMLALFFNAFSNELMKTKPVAPLKNKKSLKKNKRPPKKADEIQTLEDTLTDLQYVLSGFPKAALRAASGYQTEITPILLGYVDEVLNNPRKVKTGYCAHWYAIYLLAQFREKALFPKMMTLFHLPTEIINKILGWEEIFSYTLKNILASTFSGKRDLMSIYSLIENRQIDKRIRSVGINTLLALYTVGKISYRKVVDYFQYLMTEGLEKNHPALWASLVGAVVNLYAQELFDTVRQIFAAGYIDTEIIKLNDLEDILTEGKKRSREITLYAHYHLIQDAYEEMLQYSSHPMAKKFRENVLIDLLVKYKGDSTQIDIRRIRYSDFYP